MPAFAGKSLLVLARNRGVKLNHRLATLDRRVRSARNNDARLDETLPRIRTFQTRNAETARREEEIANRVRRLHRWNDSKLRETRNVSRVNDLRVLDAPARLRDFSFGG